MASRLLPDDGVRRLHAVVRWWCRPVVLAVVVVVAAAGMTGAESVPSSDAGGGRGPGVPSLRAPAQPVLRVQQLEVAATFTVRLPAEERGEG